MVVYIMQRITDQQQLNMVGQRIRGARIQAGLSQKELSEQLELLAVYICRGSVSRIENGSRIVTDIELDALAKVLHVSFNYLFGKDE